MFNYFIHFFLRTYYRDVYILILSKKYQLRLDPFFIFVTLIFNLIYNSKNFTPLLKNYKMIHSRVHGTFTIIEISRYIFPEIN